MNSVSSSTGSKQTSQEIHSQSEGSVSSKAETSTESLIRFDSALDKLKTEPTTGQILAGNVNSPLGARNNIDTPGTQFKIQPSSPDTVSIDDTNYQIGITPRPDISHDNGFLQNPDDASDPTPIATRPPTDEERTYYQNEKLRAAGGNFISAIPGAGIFDSRANLDEAIDAYSHFLNGGGETYNVDYTNYLEDDAHGNITRTNVIEDVRLASDQLFSTEVANGNIDLDAINPGDTVTFVVSGDAISVTEDIGANPDARFPYPSSENWQKAIGGHSIYTQSEISVTRLQGGELLASADINVNFEDRYNFNRGQQDIATQVPDSERGVLEESGLAHQFDQVGQSQLSTQWIIGTPGSSYEAPSSNWTYFR